MNKPRLIQHVCKSEPGCITCKDYINKLDKYRQSILSEVGSKREIIFRLAQTSELDKIDENKRKFDLPTPRLSRPFSLKTKVTDGISKENES